MLNEEIKAAPKPTLESALEKDNLPWLNAQASAKPDDLCWVQPPDAENRMSGGVEGLRGEIPVSPSDSFGLFGVYPATLFLSSLFLVLISARRTLVWAGEFYSIPGPRHH